MPDSYGQKPFRKSTSGYSALLSLLCGGLLHAASLQAQGIEVGKTVNTLTVEHSEPAPASSLPAVALPLPDAPEVVTKVDHAIGTTTHVSAYPGEQGTGNTGLPTVQRKEHRFLLDLVGPTAFIAPAFQAGVDTARPLKSGYPSDGLMAPGSHPAHGDVPEWGEGAQGYAKRYADRFGQGLVGTTSRYALGEVLREDFTYHRCQCSGVLPRTAHAFLGTYTAYARSGRAVPSLPAAAAPFIASEVAVAGWYPGRYNASDALRISVLNYVAAPFKNLFAEFLAK